MLTLPRARWQVTIAHAKGLEGLKKSVRLDGDESPGRAGLRSVCWKVSLTPIIRGEIISFVDLLAFPKHRGHGMVPYPG